MILNINIKINRFLLYFTALDFNLRKTIILATNRMIKKRTNKNLPKIGSPFKGFGFFIIMIGFLFSACSDPGLELPGGEDPGNKPPVELDTLVFNVRVYVDRASVEGHLGASERTIKTKMDELFRKVTNYWNESSKGKLKHKYRYSVADVFVYDGSSSDASFRSEIYNGPINFDKYDVTVLFDCLQDNGETGNGGAAHGGGSDNRSVVTVIAGPNDKKDIFTDNTYRTLVHELGHYRGVTDMYQYIIEKADNPVSNLQYLPPKCIMSNASDGEWSDYAAGCMNYVGGAKQIGKVFPDFFNKLYPEKIEINVTIAGEPKRGITVNFYGSRAGGSGHNRDIWPEIFVSKKTDTNGKCTLNNVKEYYVPNKNHDESMVIPPDLPYGRLFGLLAEVINGNQKKYIWMPEYEVQMPFFKGEKTYTATVAF